MRTTGQSVTSTMSVNLSHYYGKQGQSTSRFCLDSSLGLACRYTLGREAARAAEIAAYAHKCSPALLPQRVLEQWYASCHWSRSPRSPRLKRTSGLCLVLLSAGCHARDASTHRCGHRDAIDATPSTRHRAGQQKYCAPYKCPKEKEAVQNRLSFKAKKGGCDALNSGAGMQMRGTGVRTRKPRAVELLRRAAPCSRQHAVTSARERPVAFSRGRG